MSDIKTINLNARKGRHRVFPEVTPTIFEIMKTGGQSWGIEVTDFATAGEQVRSATGVEFEVPKDRVIVLLESDKGVDMNPFIESTKQAAELDSRV